MKVAPRGLEECSQTRHNEMESQQIPAALMRLLPHNASGPKEHMVALEDGDARAGINTYKHGGVVECYSRICMLIND